MNVALKNVSICFTFVAVNLIPFGNAVLSNSSGITSVSIVGGRSSTTEARSLAEKMMLPMGAMRFAVWSLSGENDTCVCLAVSWAT